MGINQAVTNRFFSNQVSSSTRYYVSPFGNTMFLFRHLSLAAACTALSCQSAKILAEKAVATTHCQMGTGTPSSNAGSDSTAASSSESPTTRPSQSADNSNHDDAFYDLAAAKKKVNSALQEITVIGRNGWEDVYPVASKYFKGKAVIDRAQAMDMVFGFAKSYGQGENSIRFSTKFRINKQKLDAALQTLLPANAFRAQQSTAGALGLSRYEREQPLIWMSKVLQRDSDYQEVLHSRGGQKEVGGADKLKAATQGVCEPVGQNEDQVRAQAPVYISAGGIITRRKV